jgi:aromatic ring-opening dioxygenase catalytic subunit (LigB family)
MCAEMRANKTPPHSFKGSSLLVVLFTIAVLYIVIFKSKQTTAHMSRGKSFFVPHGGGPMPLTGDPSHEPLIAFLTKKARQLINLDNKEERPKAIILVTAHWEERQPTISSGEKHDLYFDYYGFPKEAYQYTYPAPGSPTIANKVFNLLKNAGFSPKLDTKRGWDHGVFVPLKLLVPDADIPIVQLSVLSSQNAAEHIKMGKALEPLRDEGIAIIGSGMSFVSILYSITHNLAQHACLKKCI